MEESIKSGYENIKKLRDGQISIEKRITNLEHCNKSTPKTVKLDLTIKHQDRNDQRINVVTAVGNNRVITKKLDAGGKIEIGINTTRSNLEETNGMES